MEYLQDNLNHESNLFHPCLKVDDRINWSWNFYGEELQEDHHKNWICHFLHPHHHQWWSVKKYSTKNTMWRSASVEKHWQSRSCLVAAIPENRIISTYEWGNFTPTPKDKDLCWRMRNNAISLISKLAWWKVNKNSKIFTAFHDDNQNLEDTSIRLKTFRLPRSLAKFGRITVKTGWNETTEQFRIASILD